MRLKPRIPASLSFGLLLIGIAVIALIFSKDIQQPGIRSGGDPGPKAFPIAIAILMIVGGTFEAGRWFWQHRRSHRAYEEFPAEFADSEADDISAAGKLNVLILVIAMAVYLPAITFIGFSISTFLFATGMMIRLGTRAWLAAATTLGLLILIRLLFVFVFGVQLPEGLLDEFL